MRRDRIEIGAVRAAVLDRDLDRIASGDLVERGEGGKLAGDGLLERRKIGLQRIEMNAERRIARSYVADAAGLPRADARRQEDRALVDHGIDRRLEFDEQHGITARVNFHASAASSLRWMPPNPPFDMTTIRSPDCASFDTAPTIESTSGRCRARTFAAVRSSTSFDSDKRSSGGRLDLNTEATTTSSAPPKARAKSS